MGCKELWSRREQLMQLVIQVGGFSVPFDQERPVTYPSGEALPKGHPAVFGFGNRLELFGTLRMLFLCQSLFMSIRAILAKAYELGMLSMQDLSEDAAKGGDQASGQAPT